MHVALLQPFVLKPRHHQSCTGALGFLAAPAMAPKRPGSAAAGAAAKRSSSNSVHSAVTKALYDNFRDWDHELIYVKKVSGVTLHEMLTRDKEDQRTTGRVMLRPGLEWLSA